MPTLTPTQQKDLKTYQSTGELGSLKDLFIEDCLEELDNNPSLLHKIRDKVFNSPILHNCYKLAERKELKLTWQMDGFKNLEEGKQYIIQTLLSRTPEGEAVMPFLDTGKNYPKKTADDFQNTRGIGSNVHSQALAYEMNRLLHIPLRQRLLERFVEVCFNQGKGFDLALETITKIYIDHFYA